jgi:Flp pilus assembly protein TadG
MDTVKFALRRGGNGEGAIAVEFALIMPVLILMLFAIIQFGNIMLTRQMMVYAAREAARSYAVGESTASEAIEIALDRLSDSSLTFDVNVTEPSGGSNDVSVQVTVPMADAALVNVLSTLFSGDIETTVTMRSESS